MMAVRLGLEVLARSAEIMLVLGPDITARNIYPGYALAKKISIGHFLQRIEAIMATMWLSKKAVGQEFSVRPIKVR
ncbi:hypothetical protein QOZ95_001962 [Paenibacillus brasilensis]|uniref:Uncharacterized protein n=1 Tax=Paenibacillus brasilensis TaxID=128574 RepID=A0ABU0KWN1_9BACL|nr:hypothetical protein [Paenibacillus brasilensis]